MTSPRPHFSVIQADDLPQLLGHSTDAPEYRYCHDVMRPNMGWIVDEIREGITYSTAARITFSSLRLNHTTREGA